MVVDETDDSVRFNGRYLMNDQELLAGFRRSRLDVFPHEDHLRVAYLLVREQGEAQGAQEFVRGLRRLAYRFGALPFMLHMTRTKAWIKLIAGEIDDPGQTSAQFLDAHPHLRRKDLLDDYYSWGRLNSLRARITFVEGNRKPLPASTAIS
jgi:hypothetical protein